MEVLVLPNWKRSGVNWEVIVSLQDKFKLFQFIINCNQSLSDLAFGRLSQTCHKTILSLSLHKGSNTLDLKSIFTFLYPSGGFGERPRSTQGIWKAITKY